MPIYFLFLLENPHTLMERTIHFGVILIITAVMAAVAMEITAAMVERIDYG